MLLKSYIVITIAIKAPVLKQDVLNHVEFEYVQLKKATRAAGIAVHILYVRI
jgi:hypothetical protein